MCQVDELISRIDYCNMIETILQDHKFMMINRIILI